MKKNYLKAREGICYSLYLLTLVILFSSCKKNDFEIVYNENKLLKNDEILNLNITQEKLNYEYDGHFYEYDLYYLYIKEKIEEKIEEIIRGDPSEIFFEFENGDSERLYLLSHHDSRYLSDNNLYYFREEIARARERITQRIGKIKEIIIKNEPNQTIVIKGRDLISGYFDYGSYTKENLKGIQSKISIENNSNQIIEYSNLTVVINYTFETQKVFKYIRPYPAHKVWKKNEMQEWNLEDVIGFAEGSAEAEIFKIHTPKNVTIEYYLTAKNSVGYNNIGNLTETINLNFYYSHSRVFGLFTSKPLEAKEILGLGTKIASEDITNLWNKD